MSAQPTASRVSLLVLPIPSSLPLGPRLMALIISQPWLQAPIIVWKVCPRSFHPSLLPPPLPPHSSSALTRDKSEDSSWALPTPPPYPWPPSAPPHYSSPAAANNHARSPTQFAG